MILRARDFGIFPDQQSDAAPRLRELIAKAAENKCTVIELEKGQYVLEEDSQRIMFEFRNCHDITIRGSVNANMEPCTCLKIKMPLGNDVEAKGFVAIRSSRNITLENLVFDYIYRPSSAGRIVEVSPERDRVVVDVLEGQSHFEHMKCYSANCWDLATGTLKHTAPLTIGVDKSVFAHTWTWIPGGEGRRYEISNMNFANVVQPGDGISWHFNVIGVGEDKPHVIIASNSENLRFNNLRIRSCMGMTGIFVCNRNISMNRVRVEPDGTSLAVSPRDFAWMRCNCGTLIIEDCYVKGVRWDPFNIWSGMYQITKISQDRKHLVFEMPSKYQTFCHMGNYVCFWTENGALDIAFETVESTQDGFAVTFAEPLDMQICENSYLTPGWAMFDRVRMSNTTIEDNCGTGLLFQNQNLTVEHCTFRNNTYDAIALGPISGREGGFARNISIRESSFESNTWVIKDKIHNGAISICNAYEPLQDKPYNENIEIIGNRFKDCDIGVCVRCAQEVHISENQMQAVKDEIVVKAPCEHED